MRRRRIIEEQVMVPVPRSMLTVAAPPATVTQRTSLAVFGVPPRKFLDLAGAGAFPVKVEGKLRVARFADVEAYLTSGSTLRGPPPPPRPANATGKAAASAPGKGDQPGGGDAALRKMGFTWPAR